MKLRPFPIIGITNRHRIVHRATTWRASVQVLFHGHDTAYYIFDPPYQRIVTGRFGLTPPVSKRYRGVVG